MSSFLAIESYSPFLVLLVGITTYIGILGLGAAVMRIFQLRLPDPWSQVAAVLLGIQLLSLTVQLTGMTGLSSKVVLVSIWWCLIVIGGAGFWLYARPSIPVRPSDEHGPAILLRVIAAIAIAANLLVAMAPSTKHDELFYHMLVPSRIVADGAMLFYQRPLLGAVWPQMIFQISTTPIHAIGFPDAGNVVSCALGLTLIWFAWRIINESAKPAGWARLWVAVLCAGLYSVIWQVTSGSHAMGDLAMAVAIVAYCRFRQMLGKVDPVHLGWLFSILLLSAAASKVSLLPLSSAMLLAVGVPLFRVISREKASHLAVALAAPWLIFYLPIASWTWWNSGSPFGPILSDVFPNSIYDVNVVDNIFREIRESLRLPDRLISTFAIYSPLLWVGVIGSLTASDLSRSARVTVASFLVLQCVLILMLLPYDLRFLGGIHFGLMIVFACHATTKMQVLLSRKRFLGFAATILLLPWLGAQVYYAREFFRVSLGLQSPVEFCEKYVAFFADYKKLDRILPKDAVILSMDYQLSPVYAPRPIYMSAADLPRGRKAYFIGDAGNGTLGEVVSGVRLGDVVYRNARAVVQTFRMPGKLPEVEPVFAAEILKD